MNFSEDFVIDWLRDHSKLYLEDDNLQKQFSEAIIMYTLRKNSLSYSDIINESDKEWESRNSKFMKFLKSIADLGKEIFEEK